MKNDDFSMDLIGKSIRLVVNEGNKITVFSCRVLAIDDRFIKIHDKFDNIVMISLSNIIKIELEADNNG